MSRLGYIYLISNDFDDKVYIGQTARDIDTRFTEHCSETRGNSHLHNAIQKYGWQHFKVKEIEQVPLEELDEREKYWIKYYNSCEIGYNLSQGGKGVNLRDYVQIQVVENGLIFDSKEELARLVSETTSWSLRHVKERVGAILNTDKTFCDYHLISTHVSEREVSDRDTLIDWIKTLNIRFQGKHIMCVETEQEFDTIGEAAKFYVDNGFYQGKAKMPIQSLVTSIGAQLSGKANSVSALGDLHFIYLPGTTKQKGSAEPFTCKKVFCPELGIEKDSQAEMAEYLVATQWKNIKVKTAKLRISDVIRGVFPSYRGLTFQSR